MSGALLVLWLALLGADRIDLLAGSGPFVLTPFLVLTPLVIASEAFRILGRRGRLVIPPGAAAYTLVATGLLCVATLSAFHGLDVSVSAKRVVLLIVQLYSTLLVALALANRLDLAGILARGAGLGIVVSVLFNVAQLALWARGIVDREWEAGQIVNLVPSTYAGIVPRLSGQVLDQNRGGLVMLVFLVLLSRYGRPSRARAALQALAILSIVLTLSRSVLLAGAATWLLHLVLERKVRLSLGRLTAVFLVTGLAAGGVLLSPAVQDALSAAGSLVSQRFSSSEGSARIHLELISRGVEVATSSVRRSMTGIGFGCSYLLLQDLFPGNDHGNFHSLYVTLLAESGALALGLGLTLLLVPLVRPGPFRALIGGMVFFNVFYQSHTDPAFWLVLALAWLGVERARRDTPRDFAESWPSVGRPPSLPRVIEGAAS